MSPIFIFIYLSFAIVISAMIGIYAWRHRDARGCRAFAFLIFVSITWMSGMIFFRLSSDYSTWQWISRAIQYLGIVSVPPALFVFVYRYCGKELNRKKILLLFALPLVSWIVLADLFHFLFYTTAESLQSNTLRSSYFWRVHVPYSYILVTASLVKVFFEISRTSRQYRGQIIILFGAMCIPVTADILGLTGVLGQTNISPLSFLIFFTMMAISISRYQFLGTNPIAYETVFHTIRDSVIILDRNDIVRDINSAAARRFEKEPKAIMGLSLKEAFSGSPDLIANFEKQKRQSEEIDVTVADADRFLSLDIASLNDIDGSVRGRVVVLRDVTERKQQQISLSTLAFHDSLTRLANRRKFEEEVEKGIERAAETGKSFALLFIDLNRFKTVNDTMGHDVGDELLKYVAARIASILRKPDILARLGGDEFAILLHDTSEKGVELVVERILDNVQRPFKVGKHTLKADLSIGAAFYPENGNSLQQLMRHADAAMYQAKSQGGGLTLYSPGSEMEN